MKNYGFMMKVKGVFLNKELKKAISCKINDMGDMVSIKWHNKTGQLTIPPILMNKEDYLVFIALNITNEDEYDKWEQAVDDEVERQIKIRANLPPIRS